MDIGYFIALFAIMLLCIGLIAIYIGSRCEK